MAAGSQAEKGIWALLVDAPKQIRKRNKVLNSYELTDQRKKFHEDMLDIKNKQNKKTRSPIRFLKAVIKPALNDLEFVK